MTAAEKILRKALVASGPEMDSRAWNSVQAGLRDRAFWASQVAELQVLDAFRTSSAAHAAGATSMSKLRMALRDYMSKGGMKPGDGTIKDLFSKARLDVIVKTNVATARGFVRWQAMNTPGAYAAFPAQRLLRIRQRRQGRDWAARWKAAGDSVGWRGASRDYGTMVALKNSPIWQALGEGAGGFRDGLGNPYPPFAWGSGMGVVGVPRREVIELGLISDGELREKTAEMERKRDAAEQPGMNAHLQAEIPMHHDSDAAQWLQERFGDQIRFDGDRAVWQNDAVREVLEGKRGKARLGAATQGFLDMLRGVATPEEFASLSKMNPSFTRSVFQDHAVKHFGGNEKRLADNIPLEAGDYELMASVWRKPDRVIRPKDGTFVLELETFDGGFLQLALNSHKGFASYYKTKMPLGTAAGNYSLGVGRLGPTAPGSVPQNPTGGQA